MKQGLSARLTRLDASIFAAESAVVAAISVLMCVVVFADVVHRIFSRSPGRLAVLLAGVTGNTPEIMDAGPAPLIIAAFLMLTFYGAVRTRRRDDGKVLSRLPAAGLALALLAGATAVVQGFIYLKPDGIVWAPYLGLSSLLWIGLIGASMATHAGRHLALEMGEKLWPKAAQPLVRTLAQLLAASFAVLIVVLGCTSMADYFTSWRESPHAALVPALDAPKWIVFSVVPYSFAMIALRYALRALGVLPQPSADVIPGVSSEEAT